MVLTLFNPCSSQPWFYSMVIDAGSKGSRLIIYKWQPDLTTPRKRIQIPVIVRTKSVNPGLAAFALNTSGLKDSLKELVDFASETLKSLTQVHHLIPLYLKATAGLRDLVPTARDAVMTASINFLKNYSPFRFDSRSALVISGEEEGAFAWLSVNAMKGVLGLDRGESTIGVVDLGGASVQLSFVPEQTHYVLQNCYPITLTDLSTYRLYAKSYLHYGIVEANRRLASNIITENILKVDSVAEIRNPCYYQGMDFVPDFATSKYKIPISVQMRGTGNFTECIAELEKLFEKNGVNCFVRDCTFDGVYQPRLDRRPFIGIGNVGKVLSLAGVPRVASLKQIYAAGARICSMSLEQIRTSYSSLQHKIQRNLCFSVAYIFTLLTYGFGFTISDLNDSTGQMSQIEFSDQIAGMKVDWALGSMIWEANQQPPDSIPEYLRAAKDLDTGNIVAIGQSSPSAELDEDDFEALPDIRVLKAELVMQTIM